MLLFGVRFFRVYHASTSTTFLLPPFFFFWFVRSLPYPLKFPLLNFHISFSVWFSIKFAFASTLLMSNNLLKLLQLHRKVSSDFFFFEQILKMHVSSVRMVNLFELVHIKHINYTHYKTPYTGHTKCFNCLS